MRRKTKRTEIRRKRWYLWVSSELLPYLEDRRAVQLTFASRSTRSHCAKRILVGKTTLSCKLGRSSLFEALFSLQESKKGRSALKVINASEGSEFCTNGASLGLLLMSLASPGKTFLISA